MTSLSTLSPVVGALVGLLTVLGAAVALVGSFGLLRLPTFYERVHPPTMGTTAGVALTLAASMLLFTALESRPVLHELLIGAFMVVTTPVTYLLLVRAAVHRDAIKGQAPGTRTGAAQGARDTS
jgi:multicomponent K+:H+ antiporter subunit G